MQLLSGSYTAGIKLSPGSSAGLIIPFFSLQEEIFDLGVPENLSIYEYRISAQIESFLIRCQLPSLPQALIPNLKAYSSESEKINAYQEIIDNSAGFEIQFFYSSTIVTEWYQLPSKKFFNFGYDYFQNCFDIVAGYSSNLKRIGPYAKLGYKLVNPLPADGEIIIEVAGIYELNGYLKVDTNTWTISGITA